MTVDPAYEVRCLTEISITVNDVGEGSSSKRKSARIYKRSESGPSELVAELVWKVCHPDESRCCVGFTGEEWSRVGVERSD